MYFTRIFWTTTILLTVFLNSLVWLRVLVFSCLSEGISFLQVGDSQSCTVSGLQFCLQLSLSYAPARVPTDCNFLDHCSESVLLIISVSVVPENWLNILTWNLGQFFKTQWKPHECFMHLFRRFFITFNCTSYLQILLWEFTRITLYFLRMVQLNAVQFCQNQNLIRIKQVNIGNCWPRVGN